MNFNPEELKGLYSPLSIEGISRELLELLPLEKDDRERVEKIKEKGYPGVKPIIPHLLSWLEDVNWPNAGYLIPFFRSIIGQIVEEVRVILKGSDLIHISWILEYLLNDPVEPQIARQFREELSSLAADEDEEEAYVTAREILAFLDNE